MKRNLNQKLVSIQKIKFYHNTKETHCLFLVNHKVYQIALFKIPFKTLLRQTRYVDVCRSAMPCSMQGAFSFTDKEKLHLSLNRKWFNFPMMRAVHAFLHFVFQTHNKQ